MRETKVVQRAFRAFRCICVVYGNICAGAWIISSRQIKLQVQLAFQTWSDCAYHNRDDPNPTISVNSGVCAETEQAWSIRVTTSTTLLQWWAVDDENRETIGRQEHIAAIVCQIQGAHMRNKVRCHFCMTSYAVFHMNILRIITERILAQKVFWAW